MRRASAVCMSYYIIPANCNLLKLVPRFGEEFPEKQSNKEKKVMPRELYGRHLVKMSTLY